MSHCRLLMNRVTQRCPQTQRSVLPGGWTPKLPETRGIYTTAPPPSCLPPKVLGFPSVQTSRPLDLSPISFVLISDLKKTMACKQPDSGCKMVPVTTTTMIPPGQPYKCKLTRYNKTTHPVPGNGSDPGRVWVAARTRQRFGYRSLKDTPSHLVKVKKKIQNCEAIITTWQTIISSSTVVRGLNHLHVYSCRL